MKVNLPSYKIQHLVVSMKDKSAGPSISIPSLAMASAKLGRQVEILTLSTTEKDFHNCTVRVFQNDFSTVPILRDLAFSHSLKRYMAESQVSITHAHGLWLIPNTYIQNVNKKLHNRVITAPRGMLGEGALKFSKIKKGVFWNLKQRRALNFVDCWHATSIKEYADIRNMGFSQPVAVVPNGVAIPEGCSNLDSGKKTVLYIGRIHPKKGIDSLLRSWADLTEYWHDWKLEIYGPMQNRYATEYAELANSLKLDSVFFKEAIFGSDKLSVLSSAEFMVLPSLDENFGMTVAESLASGTPVICSDKTPWGELQQRKCGIFYPVGDEGLKHAMKNMMQLTGRDRQRMGAHGKNWMIESFSWKNIAVRMDGVYSWLEGNTEPPDCVFFD